MDANNSRRTILSVGDIIHEALTRSEEVSKRCTAVYPVICSSDAKLPYVVFKRSSSNAVETKGVNTADSCSVTCFCYSEDYDEGVEVAEAVAGALAGHTLTKQYDDGQTLMVRNINLADSDEGYDEGAYIQVLVFNVKANTNF